MRSLSVVVLVVVALYLVSLSAGGDVSFNLSDPIPESYNDFIENLRNVLKNSSAKAKGIPILRQTASKSARFLSAHLTNEDKRTITLGIDVVNAYVVAYKSGDKSYYLNDAPSEAYNFLFNGTTRKILGFSGTYSSLEGASANRRRVDLGITQMGFAIENMFQNKNYNSVAKAFLVLIQAVSEASRFKYIQKSFSENAYTKFFPDPQVISLENKWGALSLQIQIAEDTKNDTFERPVSLEDADGNAFKVNNANSNIVREMGLLLYKNNKVFYDEEDERDTDAVSNISVGVGDEQIISTAAAAAAMEMASYHYSFTHRKSFLNGDGRFKVMDKDIPTLNPARHAIAAM